MLGKADLGSSSLSWGCARLLAFLWSSGSSCLPLQKGPCLCTAVKPFPMSGGTRAARWMGYRARSKLPWPWWLLLRSEAQPVQPVSDVLREGGRKLRVCLRAPGCSSALHPEASGKQKRQRGEARSWTPKVARNCFMFSLETGLSNVMTES